MNLCACLVATGMAGVLLSLPARALGGAFALHLPKNAAH